MPSLEIISVYIWDILISLCNLLILFLILKKFLFAPVKRTLAKRQAAIDGQYDEAAEAKRKALADRSEWAEKLEHADEEAEEKIRSAAVAAERRGETILAEAREKADGIVRQAQTEAKREQEKASAAIREEIADISAELAGKLLEREVNEADHRRLVDSFIQEIGENHDGNK